LLVQFANGIVLTQSGKAVFNIPFTSGSFEGMFPDTNEWKFFALWWRKESDYCVAVTSFVYFGSPEAVVVFSFAALWLTDSLYFFD